MMNDSQPHDAHAIAASKKISVLLVDDDRLVLATMALGLERAGYQLGTAESVSEAEAWLCENNAPDIVIIDVNMPDRSGLELPQRLSQLGHIPFILLTARSEADIIARANALGAMAYLVKPIEIVQLIPAIETAISRAQELKGLQTTQHQLQTALDADRSISIATGMVMDKYYMGYDDAYALLRNNARSKSLKLIQLASSIIKSPEKLNLLK